MTDQALTPVSMTHLIRILIRVLHLQVVTLKENIYREVPSLVRCTPNFRFGDIETCQFLGGCTENFRFGDQDTCQVLM